ncbi:uncharacterized protein LOC134150112 [Rhea pennata]|uniref:uncharacterized protein LOC134150112 n=1 Tax=Rhea pennata TaxID=8795 RepID=UPI002E269717
MFPERQQSGQKPTEQERNTKDAIGISHRMSAKGHAEMLNSRNSDSLKHAKAGNDRKRSYIEVQGLDTLEEKAIIISRVYPVRKNCTTKQLAQGLFLTSLTVSSVFAQAFSAGKIINNAINTSPLACWKAEGPLDRDNKGCKATRKTAYFGCTDWMWEMKSLLCSISAGSSNLGYKSEHFFILCISMHFCYKKKPKEVDNLSTYQQTTSTALSSSIQQEGYQIA